MTRASRSGDIKFAILPVVLFALLAATILTLATQRSLAWPAMLWVELTTLAWGAGFVWWRRIDVRRLVGAWPASRVLLRWCAIDVASTLLSLTGVALLAAGGGADVDLDRTFGFGKVLEAGTTSAVLALCLQPFVDSFVFQGLVLHSGLRRWGARAAVLASALAVAAAHANLLFLLQIGAGILAAAASRETRGLWVPLVMQVVSNVVMIALVATVALVSETAPHAAQQALATLQGGPLAGGVAVAFMAWLALVAWVFARVPADEPVERDAPLAAT